MNAINTGIDENDIGGSVKTAIMGIKRIVTGTLSSKPERTEVITKIMTHSKNKLDGVIDNTKFSSKAIIPAFSNENTNTKRLIKKNTILKSTFVK